MPSEYSRAGWFTGLILLITVAGDGFSGRPIGLVHQLYVLPLTCFFLWSIFRLLDGLILSEGNALWTPLRGLLTALLFEIVATALFFYECRHFAFVGYRLHAIAATLTFGAIFAGVLWLAIYGRARALPVLLTACACYIGGLALAIVSFPLNYLRSDMLPVTLWADTQLLHHLSPYQTMYVGQRVYDFPYLPGILLAYLPAVALHLDLRFVCMTCVVASAGLIYWAARPERRLEVATLLALFLTCPYLQYRHDLYNQPHWLTLVICFVLMQWRRFGLAALVFGVSMATYQFSWIIFPFFLLNAFRRRGWAEALKLTGIALCGVAVLMGPFLSSAFHHIANNTVGQWGTLVQVHANADPINLSYWITYVIPPDKLMRLQALLMAGIFGYCVFARRCATLTDTLRWMIVALTVFILCNVIVDGYFYLMLLVPLLIYTCVANGWWREPSEAAVHRGIERCQTDSRKPCCPLELRSLV